MLDYGVSGSTTKTGSVPICGQTGGGTTTSHSGSFNTYGYGGSNMVHILEVPILIPAYGIVGSQSYSYTHYQRYFMMKIIDKINEKPKPYETKVASEGSNVQFGPVAECIFDAALENFPLASTENSVLLMDDCGKY